MSAFIESASLLYVLMNPFLLGIYLLDLIRGLSFRQFSAVLLRATLISTVVFCLFCIFGDRVFQEVMHARFASFQIFGGIVFLIIGIRFVLGGSETITALRGEPEYVSGSKALPFMIGPGTVSAAVLIGGQHDPGWGIGAIATAMVGALISILLFKKGHDLIKEKHETLLDRYVDITGRLMALFIGTYSVEMICQGVERWLSSSPALPL